MNILIILIRLPLALLRLIIVLIFTLCLYLYIKIFPHLNSDKQNKILVLWSKGILQISGIKLRIFDNHNFITTGLLLPNHRSYIDIFMILGIAPSKIIAKIEISKWPLISYGLRNYKMLLLNRNSMASRMKILRDIVEMINLNKRIVIFPEGTTYKSPEIGSLKKGTFQLAAKNNISIQPIAIELKDVNDSWVGKDLFVTHFLRQSGIIRREVGISIGKPLKSH